MFFDFIYMLALSTGFSVKPQTGASGSLNAFSALRDLVYTNGNGVIYILLTLFGVVAVIALLIASGGLMFGGSRERSAAKSHLVWVIVIAALGFSVIGIATTIATVADSLF